MMNEEQVVPGTGRRATIPMCSDACPRALFYNSHEGEMMDNEQVVPGTGRRATGEWTESIHGTLPLMFNLFLKLYC